MRRAEVLLLGGFDGNTRQQDVWIWQVDGAHDVLEHHLWADGCATGRRKGGGGFVSERFCFWSCA